jgi:F0F1-type ATP synthase epsilon subunit
MSEGKILAVIQTPNQIVFEAPVSAMRVPTQTGQVGIRVGMEPLVLIVEPGLVSLRDAEKTSFVGTSGGLLDAARDVVRFLSPVAIVGSSPEAVLDELNAQLGMPDSELMARRRLGELEARIIEELKSDAPKPPLPGVSHD